MGKIDRIIIGAGIYGLYAARECGKREEILERVRPALEERRISIKREYIWDITIREV